MKLQMPFDAALVLNGTPLRHEHPDVWRRYEDKTNIRFGMRTGAVAYTQVGAQDLLTICRHFDLWLAEQELIPDELRDKDSKKCVQAVQGAVHAITYALQQSGVLPSDHATADD